ncbi:hypothetical protein HDU77_000748 [Chytriomyces hyalinus]|nr:hypothetical protein HDU77_000748 [Chytriomyces hyalinus]
MTGLEASLEDVDQKLLEMINHLESVALNPDSKQVLLTNVYTTEGMALIGKMKSWIDQHPELYRKQFKQVLYIQQDQILLENPETMLEKSKAFKNEGVLLEKGPASPKKGHNQWVTWFLGGDAMVSDRTREGRYYQNMSRHEIDGGTHHHHHQTMSEQRARNAAQAVPDLEQEEEDEEVMEVPPVVALRVDWTLDEDSGDDIEMNDDSDQELFEEYYSQTPAPETHTESENDDEMPQELAFTKFNQTKKRKTTSAGTVGIDCSFAFSDIAPKAGQYFYSEQDFRDGLEFNVARWENVKAAKSHKIIQNADAEGKNEGKSCSGFSFMHEGLVVGCDCPYTSELSHETASYSLSVGRWEYFCFGCEFLKNNLLGNPKNNGSEKHKEQVRRHKGSEKYKEQVRRYQGSEKYKERVHRYQGSEKYKEQVCRYQGSEKYKERVRRYNGSEKHKEQVRRYQGSEKYKEQVRRYKGSEKHKEQVRRYKGSEKYKEQVRRKNRRYNGSDAFYASLRKHNRTRKNRPDSTESIVDFLTANKQFVLDILGGSVNLFHAKIAVHDTEYDARGASHADEKLIREFCVLDLESKEILNIRRRLGENRIDIDPPNPAWTTIKQQLLDFDAKHNPDFYIAYEKPNNDRHRWETILGPTDYMKLKHKFVDFQKTFVNPITTLSNQSTSKQMYLPGRELTTLYKHLFMTSLLEQQLELSLFPVLDFAHHEKCNLDVNELANLFLIWKAVLTESDSDE